MRLEAELNTRVQIPYVLRRIPASAICTLLPLQETPSPGDVVLARLERVGKNQRLELANGRAAGLHEGDVFGAAFGHRYATEQFEGYARRAGDCCDLLSMGGLCGLLESKREGVLDPSRLRLLGAVGDVDGRPLRLRSFSVPHVLHPPGDRPCVIVVCGTAMDSGKTHTAKAIIVGLRSAGLAVASIKLTGTASGRDTWGMLDAGANPALDFVDGGYSSTYLLDPEELLCLHDLLMGYAASQGVGFVVVEIADGILQRETRSLLRSRAFTSGVDQWVLATQDPLAAYGAAAILKEHDIHPAAISGVISTSPLAAREATAATGMKCHTARELEQGALNELVVETHRQNCLEARRPREGTTITVRKLP